MSCGGWAQGASVLPPSSGRGKIKEILDLNLVCIIGKP